MNTLDDFEFRESTSFLTLPSNVPIVITIQPSNSFDTSNALFQTTVNLDSNETYIVIANGIISATGYSNPQPFVLDIYPFARVASVGGVNSTDVLVMHGATDAPAVDILETSIPAGRLINNLSYGDFTSYLSLAASNYVIDVRDSVNSKIIASYSAPLSTLNAGGLAVTVIASGFLDSTQNSNGRSFGLFAATPAGGALIQLPQVSIPTARVQVIHNSADLAAEFVDVWLNDGVLVDNFEFRTASPFIDAQAGVPFVISISDSSSTDTTTALAQFTFNLEADSSYIVIANGIVSASGYSPATPFDLDVFVGAKEVASSSTNTEVLVYHGATDAPAVDVLETSVPAGQIVDSISYSEFQGYLNLVTADYELQIQAASNSAVVANYSAPLSTLSLGGEAITVLASGFLDPSNNSNGPAFGLWAVTSAGGTLLPLPLITGLAKIDKNMEAAISVYPNPSQAVFNLEFNSIDNKPEIIEVFDFNGRNIQEIKVSSSTFQSVDLSGFSKGIYFLRISNEDSFAVKRIILQ